MYRFATLLALLMALAAAGCGDSGNDSDSPPSAVAEATESAPSGDAGGSSPDGDAKKKAHGDEKPSDDNDAEDVGVPNTPEERLKAQREALAKVSPEERPVLVKTVVRNALLTFGLKPVDVQVRRGGRAVTAVVARRGACNFVAREEANLMVTIQEGAPSVKSGRFEVAGTGQELGYYVLRCKRPEIPSGAGRVVLDHTGVGGPYESKRFKITGKRWALEWVNEAKSLAVLVEAVGGQSEGEYFKPVGSQKPESGRYDYTGRGTFKITAYGAGGWRIRVKEIG